MIAGILSLVSAILFETIDISSLLDCKWPLLYVAFIEVTIGFTMQIIGQKYTSPSLAVIIMNLQSVFGAAFGMIFLEEIMTGREVFGCIVMLTGFLISQIPGRAGNTENVKKECQNSGRSTNENVTETDARHL